MTTRRLAPSRRWGKTDSAEKLAEHESRPAPGYDNEGNEHARFEYDAEGNLVIPGNVRIEGDLGIVGDVDNDAEISPTRPMYDQEGELITDDPAEDEKAAEEEGVDKK